MMPRRRRTGLEFALLVVEGADVVEFTHDADLIFKIINTRYSSVNEDAVQARNGTL